LSKNKKCPAKVRGIFLTITISFRKGAVEHASFAESLVFAQTAPATLVLFSVSFDAHPFLQGSYHDR
jgi:hypothetical protein